MHLDRLIAILEIIATAGRGLIAAEVQKATELPRPTCYRLLPRASKRRSSTARSAPTRNTQKHGSRPNLQGFMGVSSVAAPVLIGHIGAAFSVGAVGPVRRLEATYRKKIGEELIQVAAKISAAIQLCNVAQMQETDISLLKPMEERGNQPPRQH